MVTIIRTYLGKYPILTNSLIYGTLCVGAEFSQQTLSKKILVSIFISKNHFWETVLPLHKYTNYN